MILFLLLFMAFLMIISVIAFLIGLFKVIFQKEDKEYGIKLLIYSTIAFIVGFGTCYAIPLSGHI